MKSYCFIAFACVIAAVSLSVSSGQEVDVENRAPGENFYINFVLHGEKRTDCGEGENNDFADGVIRESTLTSGKWQINDVDVSTVNGRRFINECDNKKELRFKASGTLGSMVGVRGSYEIHFDSRRTAVVTFTSSKSGNEVLLTHVDGALYNCRHSGAPPEGPFTLDITCWKLKAP